MRAKHRLLMTVTIEPIRPEHIEGYRRVEDIVSRERKYLSHFDAGPIAVYHEFVTRHIAKGYTRFVALCDGEVIGWCQIIPNGAPAHAHVGDLDMALLPDFRGKGHGRTLIETALADAHRVGLTRIGLCTFSGNDRAIALYESVGFKHEGVLKHAVLIDGQYRDMILMAIVDERQ
jgi:RimJ/RimL family protein N-acetyltransferase